MGAFDCTDCSAIKAMLSPSPKAGFPMASLTVRQLDERLKKLLRLRAAKSGRSVEDEVRTILRAAAEETGTEVLESFTPPAESPRRVVQRARHQARVADHRRRHCRLQIARSHSPPEGARHRRALHLDQSRRAFRHAAVGRRHRRRARLHRPVRRIERIRRRPHPPRARHRSRHRRAGDRRPDGENGRRSRRRPRHRGAAGDWHQDPAGAGDEPAYVGEQGDAAQSRAARRRRLSCWSAPTKARWRKRANAASAAWPSRWRSPPRRRNCSPRKARSRLTASACW